MADKNSEDSLAMTPARYEFSDGTSHKFWEITLSDDSHTVTYGRIGTDGTTKTKEFADAGEAKASATKLIAQKTKKGYVLAGGTDLTTARADSTDTAPAKKKAATKKATAKSDTKKATAGKMKAAENEAAPEAGDGEQVGSKEAGDAAEADSGETKADVVMEITSRVNLQPQDWHRATFRKLDPIAIEDRPFDPDVAKKQLMEVPEINYDFAFHSLNLTASMSVAEANYWWAALAGPEDNRRAMAKAASTSNPEGTLTVAKAEAALKNWKFPDEAAGPMYRLLGHDNYMEVLWKHGTKKPKRGHLAADVHSGFIQYVLPCLDEEQREQLRDQVLGAWPSLQMPTTHYESFPIHVYFAAALGMQNELHQVLDGIEDDRYGKTRGDDWDDHYQNPQELVLGLPHGDAVASEWRRLGIKFRSPLQVRAFLACTELSELQFVAETICRETSRKEAEGLVEAFTLVEAAEAAEPMLYIVQNSKAPALARAWLDKFVGNAIAGLTDTAGGRDKLAAGAAQYLRDAKRDGHESLIRDAIKGLAADVAAKVTRDVIDHVEKIYTPLDDSCTPEWLATELAAVEKLKPKNAADWAVPAQMPKVTIGEEHCLNETQVGTVLKVMQRTLMPDQHPLLAAIREHASGNSCDAFAWRLFERWLESGAATKQKWAMSALGHWGGDESAFKLTPMVRTWPGQSQHPRAVHGLQCLCAIGTDTALMQLNGIAQKLKFQGLKKKAREFMEQIAERRGMTRSELEDLIVPDLELDERGTRTFDFGPRSFQFVLKSDMKPAVRDESGKVRSDLPKPSTKDERTKAEEAIENWKLLKKQLREAIKIQVPRLEQAMVTGRRWGVEPFESLLVKHPLMINFVRMLLWAGHDAKGEIVGTFRVTEEQDYADSSDEPIELDGFAEVSIVHPYYLAETDAAAWGEIFSDYELISPFPQLGREIYSVDANVSSKKELASFNDVKIGPMALVGALDRLGWNRGIPEDGGVFHEHSKPFYGADVTAVLGYECGVPIGYMQDWEDQQLTGCFFLRGIYTPQMYPDHGKAMKLGDVDPVVMSEVLADLNELRSKAR